ncbi:MAG: hypothetical protein GF307_03770 [candidate division Zixibacteria bacterium]|nr:hypothetical protein [candidate division Zixibacteria bacterium]
MSLNETDRNNWSETLMLEWSATYRYIMQTKIFNNPKLVGLIDGIMRNEADHIDISTDFLMNDFKTDVKGFRTTLFYLYQNLEFEKVANKTYGRFRRESEDEEVKAKFQELVKSEAGHVKIFRELIEAIEAGKFPVIVICPVCGWEINYGESPEEGTVLKCEKCKVDFELVEENGDWDVVRA